MITLVIVTSFYFVGFSEVDVEAQAPYPQIRVTYFEATPQALLPEVRNSGTIYLELNLNGFDLEDLDGGQLSIQKRDGSIFKAGNSWSCQDQGMCTRNLYLPIEVVGIWVDVTIPIGWEGWGPWEVGYNEGIRKKEDVTQITFTINDPLYNDWEGLYDPTWDWAVVGSPDWASTQWFGHNKVNIKINTNCSGHGTNHNGNFYWENVPTLPSMFGNGVFRQWVKEPLSPVQWEIKGTIGNWWTQNGETLGPVCWDNLIFLPLITN